MGAVAFLDVLLILWWYTYYWFVTLVTLQVPALHLFQCNCVFVVRYVVILSPFIYCIHMLNYINTLNTVLYTYIISKRRKHSGNPHLVSIVSFIASCSQHRCPNFVKSVRRTLGSGSLIRSMGLDMNFHGFGSTFEPLLSKRISLQLIYSLYRKILHSVRDFPCWI